MTAEEKDWLRLHLTRGLGRRGMLRLLEVFGPAPAILAAGPGAWVKRAGLREAVAATLPGGGRPASGAGLRRPGEPRGAPAAADG